MATSATLALIGGLLFGAITLLVCAYGMRRKANVDYVGELESLIKHHKQRIDDIQAEHKQRVDELRAEILRLTTDINQLRKELRECMDDQARRHLSPQNFAYDDDQDSKWLYENIVKSFDEGELKLLAAQLGDWADWENLPGQRKNEKAMELIQACRRMSRMGDLRAAIFKERPALRNKYYQ